MFYLAVLKVSLFRIDLSSVSGVAYWLESRELNPGRVKRPFSSPKRLHRFWNDAAENAMSLGLFSGGRAIEA
jgi:hypothetical protein